MKISSVGLILVCLFLPGLCRSMSPKDEAQQLVDAVLPFAEQSLARHGEFFPFGADLTFSGKVEMAMAGEGDARPDSTQAIAMLRAGFAQKAKAGRIRATALAYNARVQMPDGASKSDVVVIELEHRGDTP